MSIIDLKALRAAADACHGWSWPDRRRDENGTHHFGKRNEDGEFYEIGTIDASNYTGDYADDLRVLKFLRLAQPATIKALVDRLEAAEVAKQPAAENLAINDKQFLSDVITAAGLHPDCKHEEAVAIAQRVGCGDPVAWRVGFELFGSLKQAQANVRNPSLSPEPLYTTPPAAVTDADKRDAALPACQCFTDQQVAYSIHRRKCQGMGIAYGSIAASEQEGK